MATLEASFLQGQLEERKRRLGTDRQTKSYLIETMVELLGEMR
jgi:hypothetical protein